MAIINVLVVFANPRDTNSLRLGEEDRKIHECIQRSKHRDNIKLRVLHAATIEDVRRTLLEEPFSIVHFSGHGTRGGLVLEDERDRQYVPPPQALADLLASFSPECVILNACYSISQGRLTSLDVPYTIAMDGPISDEAAILFAGGFYDSIGAGKDAPFSYEQGLLAIRLQGKEQNGLPVLMRRGESGPPPDSRGVALASRAGPHSLAPLLVGLALDVSGSMEQSINNHVGSQQSRLDAFTCALDSGMTEAEEFIEAIGGTRAPVHLFAYAFGLRLGDGVCDLLALLQYANKGLTGGVQSPPAPGGPLADTAIGPIVDAFRQAQGGVLSMLSGIRTLKDVTLPLHDVVSLWRTSTTSMSRAKQIVGGKTPLCEALRRTYGRFKREQDVRKGTDSVLLLVSDGQATDGDPCPVAKQIRDLGVTIVACYITDSDVSEAKTLVESADTGWSKGAHDMFDIASVIPDESPMKAFLLEEGWRIPSQSKAFVQANHSRVLRDVVDFALSPTALLPKGQ